MTKDSRFGDLYQLYRRHVHAYCARRIENHLVDDAVAETFLVAWRKIDGYAGKQMVPTVPTDVDFADCDSGQFKSWYRRYYQAPGQIEQWWILDVDGVWLVIAAAHFPETLPQDRAELQQIIDSIQIVP